jgi:dihydrofolate synthase/folylpolyglutamate synthase
LLAVAHTKNADVYRIGEQFSYQKHATGWDWQAGNQVLHLPHLVLKGEHQYRNASSVIFAVTCLNHRLPVSESAIQSGLKNVQLAGRFQLIDGEIPVLLDVGHNPEAVKTLVDYLQENFPDKKVHAIFAMMKDKDIASVLDIMNPVIEDWFFAPLSNPRAASEAQMQRIFSQNSIAKVSFSYMNFAQAYQAAKNQARPGDLLLVFGSFLLISDCLINLKSELIK